LLSFTDYLQVDPDGGEHGSCFRSWPRFAGHIKGVAGWRSLGPAAAAMVLAENMIGTSTVVARRDVLLAAGGFDVGLASASDWDLWLKVAQLGPIGCTDAILAEHLIRRPGSISSDHGARVKSMEAIIARHAPVLAVEQPWVIRSALADVAATRAEGARADGRLWASLASRLRALALVPSLQAARELAADLIRIAAMASMFRRRSVPSGGKPARDGVAKPGSGGC
jgi:hypothetical protein